MTICAIRIEDGIHWKAFDQVDGTKCRYVRLYLSISANRRIKNVYIKIDPMNGGSYITIDYHHNL